jgi:hypothetical protein
MQILAWRKIFLSCQQYERETLPDFVHMFLHLKAQAPEVSDDQAIKALHAGQLHNYLARELEELYDNF